MSHNKWHLTQQPGLLLSTVSTYCGNVQPPVHYSPAKPKKHLCKKEIQCGTIPFHISQSKRSNYADFKSEYQNYGRAHFEGWISFLSITNCVTSLFICQVRLQVLETSGQVLDFFMNTFWLKIHHQKVPKIFALSVFEYLRLKSKVN